FCLGHPHLHHSFPTDALPISPAVVIVVSHGFGRITLPEWLGVLLLSLRGLPRLGILGLFRRRVGNHRIIIATVGARLGGLVRRPLLFRGLVTGGARALARLGFLFLIVGRNHTGDQVARTGLSERHGHRRHVTVNEVAVGGSLPLAPLLLAALAGALGLLGPAAALLEGRNLRLTGSLLGGLVVDPGDLFGRGTRGDLLLRRRLAALDRQALGIQLRTDLARQRVPLLEDLLTEHADELGIRGVERAAQA